MLKKPITWIVILLFIVTIISPSLFAETKEKTQKDRTYLISYNSYIDMDYDTSPFNKPLEIGVSHTLPINISYWTNIPDFFGRIPFQITNNFLFGQFLSPLQILNIEAINVPDWANIYFSPTLLLSDVPFKSEEKNSIEINLNILLYPEAPSESYKLDLEVSCGQIKRLKGFSYQESIDFTPE